MYQKDCTFNPNCDLIPHASGLSVDIGAALRTGKVPTKLGPSDVAYNGINNPANIVGRPSDIFDSLRMEQNALAAARKSDKEEPAVEPVEPGAPATPQE